MDHDEYLARRDQLREMGRSVWAEVLSAGWVPLQFFDGQHDEHRFLTVCPGCGASLGGILSDVPVSGWDAPRWAIQNDNPEHLTMTPSLGCGGWRAGTCIGHWWIRDGRLVLA